MTGGLTLGLTGVPTEELKRLLHHVHKGDIRCPVTPGELARIGLQDRSDSVLRGIRGLEEAGVRAVLVAVLAERDQE